jgi:hypothetical protein
METTSIVQVVLLLVLILVSVGVSDRMNKDLRQRNPEVKPYQWGYYLGIQGLIGSSLLAICGLLLILLHHPVHGRRSNLDVEQGLLCILYSFAVFSSSLFVIKRTKWGKWALIALTILSLNPVVWLVNLLYIPRRWKEFSDRARTPRMGIPAESLGGSEGPHSVRSAARNLSARSGTTHAGPEGSPSALINKKVKTLDDAVVIYAGCDLKSAVVASPSQGTEIDLGAALMVEGREWVEATLPGGERGYALGPNVRSHCS